MSCNNDLEIFDDLVFEIVRCEELMKSLIDISIPTESKRKYSQPIYRERMHPENVVFFRRCRIRDRPNSGHGFKK